MNTILYNPEIHYEIINSWAKSRGLEILPPLLSKNGFLVEENNEPILCVFVYFFLGVPVVQLDYFLSKPGMNFWRLARAWKVLFSFIKDFLNEIENLGGGKTCLIKCNIDSRLGKYTVWNDDKWITSAKDTSSLAYII